MKKRHQVLLFLIVLAIITFLDRISIASAGPRIQEELHIPAERWGWILGAFILAYGLFEVLTQIVLWCSAFTSLTAAATGFLPMLAVRFLFGAGEAGAYPNMAGVLARWFPAGGHARTQGYIWAADLCIVWRRWCIVGLRLALRVLRFARLPAGHTCCCADLRRRPRKVARAASGTSSFTALRSAPHRPARP